MGVLAVPGGGGGPEGAGGAGRHGVVPAVVVVGVAGHRGVGGAVGAVHGAVALDGGQLGGGAAGCAGAPVRRVHTQVLRLVHVTPTTSADNNIALT